MRIARAAVIFSVIFLVPSLAWLVAGMFGLLPTSHLSIGGSYSDRFILLAVAISFALSGYLWFTGNREEGLFTALWVPSILCFGIYFKLMGMIGSRK
jgi:hypothetical protein